MSGAFGIEAVASDAPGALVCGTCGRAWAEDITPAARCPWEHEHIEHQERVVVARTPRGVKIASWWALRHDAAGNADMVATDSEQEAHEEAERMRRESRVSAYPEHERLAAVAEASQTVGEFIEWLEEQDYLIAEWITHTRSGNDATLHAVHRSIESWLAQYFRIDPVKIEQEKRAMLDSMRGLSNDKEKR